MLAIILISLTTFAGGFLIAYLFQQIKLSKLTEQNSALVANLESQKINHQKLEGEFRLAAQSALKEVNEQFLSLAMRDLNQVKTEANQSVELKHQNINLSFDEIQNKIKDYADQVKRFEDERVQIYAKVEGTLKQVMEAGQSMRSETASLRQALIGNSSVRGRLGERALLGILEKNDLVRGIDFETQVTFGVESSNDARPDFVIYLPGGKHLIIDSKDVTAEYILAQETADTDKQATHYARLVQNIRSNLNRLSNKEYQSALHSDIPYVVMFIPSEAAIRAAFATDPEIFEEAIKKKILLASPVTILPLIWLVRNSRYQSELGKNARELGVAVEELGNRLAVFVDHLKSVRDGIQKSSNAWDRAVGSWQRSVLPQAERIKNLGGSLKETEELTPINSNLRELTETTS